MKTINERAIKYADGHAPCYERCGRWTSCKDKCPEWNSLHLRYSTIATEQREIDIKRACKEFKFFLDRLVEKDADALRPEILQADVKMWYEDFKNIMNDAQD